MYKVGWCSELQHVDDLAESGYDFIECALVSLCLEDREAHRQLLPRYRDRVIPTAAFNCFFPGDLKVVGPSVDKERMKQYVARAAEALESVGAKIAVLGSGGARQIPVGWEYGRAQEQFLELLALISSRFKGTGITLAIEPLNQKECNFINRVGEAAEFAQLVNQPEIRVLADFYHMQEDEEPLDTLEQHKEWLAHIHLADSGRNSPGTGAYPYTEFVEQLRRCNYEGFISVECKSTDLKVELQQSRGYIAKLFNNGMERRV
ncbi:sugar phosphate isomerase/epimerase family protein [Paenibacillus mendelii]|uniref:Sugar phosphate isomerase/epimerase family protein n=1 Tax=Paenibacillus mendelii TaxID=206163 RepID=A0ABV6JEM1_9BACL|nr:sugar phosphate isomerase/epimerase family protein [Paenibacillus mendelii]MCQ6557232.1 sugar phosphate isomerase/epimerase [Paenibacillus mendelii]